ncbi:unnamed protein product [Peniophora sp. CBMAI 1063]|nr:unnamed protein product [Peniophora sp. CBMAI 1063]
MAESPPSYDDSNLSGDAIVSLSRREPYVLEPPLILDHELHTSISMPALSHGQPTTEHSFTIGSTKGIPWLIVHLRSRAVAPESLPLYYGHDTIRGDVTLELQEGMKLKAIVLKYCCKVAYNGTILEAVHDVWRGEAGATFKLLPQGRHVIPIEFPIPYETSHPQEPGKSITLPPTFVEGGGSDVNISYTLSISVQRGGLQASKKVTLGVCYFPRSVHSTPQKARLLASRHVIDLLGPELDPLGWRTLPPVNLGRAAFHTRKVNTEYTLALAEPTSYMIGGTIPVFLTVRSPDARALESIAFDDKDVVVRLRRLVEVGPPGSEGKVSAAFIENIGNATFWPYELNSRAPEEGTRMLQGEIIIPRETVPSFTWMNISLRYDVILRPPTKFSPPRVAYGVSEFDLKPVRSVKVVIAVDSLNTLITCLPQRLRRYIPSRC